MLKCYLAGPIENVSTEVATGWRVELRERFKGLILFHSPLCGESGKAEKGKNIFTRDTLQIEHSDIIIANLVDPPEKFYGTLMEIGIAWRARKLVIVASNDDSIFEHAFTEGATVGFRTMEEAINYIEPIAKDFL